MSSQWSATAALVFIGVFLTLAFFETKLPDFMGLNSARHAKRAIHVRSHQVRSLVACALCITDAGGPGRAEETLTLSECVPGS